MARRRFFVPEVHHGQARLEGEDAEHLTRVLRVEKGQVYEISDNHRVYLAEVVTARKAEVVFTVQEAYPVPPPPPETHLYAALVKFDRLEWIVEKATELGVTHLTLVRAERSEKGLELAAPKRMERWRKIAMEASQQSRRVLLPVLDGPVTIAQVAQAAGPHRLLLDERPSAPALLRVLVGAVAADAPVSLLLGPEGGWADREHEQLTTAGWTPVSLGATVLRAETAAAAALAVVAAHRG